MLQRIHTGHLGMEKCKRRAREVMYWPRINNDIKNVVETCATCLKYRPKQQKETLNTHPIINNPWVKVSVDLFSLNGMNYLLVRDYYSSYPEVCVLNRITSKAVIDHMRAMFARHGVPEEVFRDNGHQFASN